MKYKAQHERIQELIKAAHNVLVVPHVDPDVDALGSAYAWVLALVERGYTAHVGLQSPLSKKHSRIFHQFDSYTITQTPPENHYDLLIVVDVASTTRMGKYLDLLSQACSVINLDHHVDNPGFGDLAIVDHSYSSTCELVYEVLRALGVKISAQIASALYLGIVSDSGSFRYMTTARTHEYIAELLEHPINTNHAYQDLFENYTLNVLQLQCRMIKTIELCCDGELAFSYIRQSFYEEHNITEQDSTAFIRIGLSLEGVCFSVFLNEREHGTIRVSLRSNNKTRVNKIAQLYGGGGHEKAAGFTLHTKDFDHTFSKLKKEIIHHYIQEKSS